MRDHNHLTLFQKQGWVYLSKSLIVRCLTAAATAGSSARVAVVPAELLFEDGPVAVRGQILTEDARGRQRRQLAVLRARAKVTLPGWRRQKRRGR